MRRIFCVVAAVRLSRRLSARRWSPFLLATVAVAMLRAIKLLSTAGVAAYSTSSTQAADKFIKAWASKQWISNPSDFSPPPASVAEMYETHLAIQSAAEQFGGLGGYKIGAVGAEGEPCLYGPLFSNFIVEAAGRPNASPLSASSINLFQIEPEFALVMGEDVKPRADGLPHSADDVWAAVASVVLCIECCGRRGTKEVAATIPNKLGRFNDALCAGGVVLGERRAAKYFNADSLKACADRACRQWRNCCDGLGCGAAL